MPPCWITEVLIHSFTPVQKRERERPKWMITMISLCYTGWQVCVIWDSRFKKNPPSMNQCAFFVSSGTSKIHLILNILSNKHQHPVNIQPSNIQSKIILATSFFYGLAFLLQFVMTICIPAAQMVIIAAKRLDAQWGIWRDIMIFLLQGIIPMIPADICMSYSVNDQ